MMAHGTAARVQARLRQAVHAHVLQLGPAHFTASRTGDVVLTVVEGVQQLEVYFGQYLPQLFVAALTPALIFAFMAWLDVPIALVLLGAALVTLVAPSLWHRWDSARSLARQRAYAAFGAEFLDAVQGLGTLKAFGQSGTRAGLLAARGRDLFQATMGVLGTNTLARGITDSRHRARRGGGARLGRAPRPVGSHEPSRRCWSSSCWASRSSGRCGISACSFTRACWASPPRAGCWRSSRPRRRSATRPARPPTSDGSLPTVTFDDVTFRYPGGREAAHARLTFSVQAGERVAIVGPSGSGKSTVARLLLRFHDPQSGRVLVGGRDVRDLRLADLRALMAVVHQDTYLFHGTVAENLRMGRPDATAAELEAAARQAHAHEFIARLPQGYETVVGERGVRLSGGQRQRIAIARALLRDAPILILDEALSSVDAESEALIQAALDRLMAGRTTLIFAHRLSSVIGADRILVLDGGRLAESGTHAELITRGGAYARLMAAQVAERVDQDGALAPGPTGGAGAAPAGAGPDTEPAEAILTRRAGSDGHACCRCCSD
jgi:ATP-binding cassette subfamily C protein CydCD